MGHSEFLNIMGGWLEDPRFHRLLKFNQTRHWLDVQNMREANFRDFLAWLLSPREGHGLGDYFIKRLMITEAAIAGHEWSALQVETKFFGNAFVVTEGQTPANKRIDILVVDPTNKLLILIERKDGARISAEQLGNYGQWAKKHYPEYTQCWLVSDSQEKEHAHMKESWHQLNDDWLVGALKDVVDKGHLPDDINSQFRDWILMLEGRGLWEEDAYFSNIEDELKDFVASESQAVRQLSAIEIEIGRNSYRISELDTSVGLREIFPRIDHEYHGKARSNVWTAVSLAMRYHILLEWIIETNELAVVEKEINARPEFAGKFSMETSQGPRFHRLFITLKRLDKLNEWPLFLAIEKPVDDDDSSTRLRTRLRLKVHPDSHGLLPADMWHQFLGEVRAKYPGDFPRKISARQEWMNSPWQELPNLSVASLEGHLRSLLEVERMFSLKSA